MSSTDAPAAWVPVLRVDHDAWLGLLGNTLFVGNLEGPQREIDPNEPTGLLPCLERPYSVVMAEIRDRESELSLSPGVLTRQVPLALIPQAAVSAQSNYWADLALAWLAEMPGSESVVSALEVLEVLEGASWAAQSVRHRARRIRRDLG